MYTLQPKKKRNTSIANRLCLDHVAASLPDIRGFQLGAEIYYDEALKTGTTIIQREGLEVPDDHRNQNKLRHIFIWPRSPS